MNRDISELKVSTHGGRCTRISKVQRWIVEGSRKSLAGEELWTWDGQVIAFNGSVFVLPNGDTFDPPA